MSRESERRHRQPGRRDTDATGFTAAAIVEAAAEDRLFPPWKKEDVIKWLTIVTLTGTLVAGAVSYISTRFATRAEIGEQVKPVADTLGEFRRAVIPRLARVEQRQDSAEYFQQLVVALARMKCIEAERDRSTSLTDLAGLPCTVLLRRLR